MPTAPVVSRCRFVARQYLSVLALILARGAGGVGELGVEPVPPAVPTGFRPGKVPCEVESRAS